MSHKYLYAGDHAGPLASGAQFAPGDEVPAAAVDLEDPHDQHLLDEGVLIDTQPNRQTAKRQTKKKETS